MTKKLVVIDGKSVFYRGYYAMPHLSLSDGTPSGGVYGFAMMALEVIKKMDPDYVTIAWDKSKTNIRSRTDIYPQYKANRKPMPEDMRAQIPYLMELFEAFNWPMYECDDYEADDILGTFAEQAHEKGIDTLLITSDLDSLQLVNDYTTVKALKKGLTNVESFTPDYFTEKYEMTPKQFIDYKALRGDPSDNIPGVKGVGEKTATDLIKKYGSLEKLYENIDEITGVLHTKLVQDKDMAYLSRELVTIKLDAPVTLNFEQAAISNTDPQKVYDKLQEYQFKSLVAQLPKVMKLDEKKVEEQQSIFSADTKASDITKTDVATITKADLLAIGLIGHKLVVSPYAERAFVMDIKRVDKDVQKVLADKNVGKIAYDIKEIIKTLLENKIELAGVAHDVRIAAFLINSLKREQLLSDLVGGQIDTADVSQLMAATWNAYDEQSKELKKLPKVLKLAREVEWPVLEVLARMEHLGIYLDTDYLAELSTRLAGQISDIEQEIFGHADMEFNVSSPAQLSEVLFEKLNLPTQGIKKTKTAYSTAASELAKLQGKHPIIDLIYKYREWTKLKSTYVDALPKLVDDKSRLHTTYAMDVAPTGRLSSHDPNLQNIPASEDGLGQEVRKAFVAAEGNVFISADYSQQELRLAALLSGDEGMVKAFKEGADIHTQTIVDIYGKKPEEVTKDERRNAKAINFGIMYGQGPHGLAEQTGMSFKEAKEFIDKYFEVRKGLRDYLDNLEKQVKEDGYVETFYGRRRPTPDIHSSNFMVREGARRAAMNMPFQGTAADIMKMAMIQLDAKLPKSAHMLLQIHDSVIIECPKDEAEKIAEQVKDIMESTVKLDIPLPVDYSTGKSWGEL